MNDPKNIVLIYADERGDKREQPLSDIVECGTLIDPETGDDLSLIGWRFAEGQDYVLVDGGLVQNNPALPVFDLDVLSMDSYRSDDIAEVVNLYERISAHEHASKDWSSALEDAARIVRLYGSSEDVELMEEREAARLGGPDLRAEGA